MFWQYLEFKLIGNLIMLLKENELVTSVRSWSCAAAAFCLYLIAHYGYTLFNDSHGVIKIFPLQYITLNLH